jgi:hypothetical protein
MTPPQPNSSTKKKSQKKKSMTRMQLPLDFSESLPPLNDWKRDKLVRFCEFAVSKQAKIEELNVELTKSTEVSKCNEKNLLDEIQSRETKRRKIETQCISLNKEKETLI